MIAMAPIALVSIAALVAACRMARALRSRWLRDTDAVTCLTLAAIVVMSLFLVSIHVIATGQMLGWLSGMSGPVIAGLFVVLAAIACRCLGRGESGSPAAPWPRGSWLILVPLVITHIALAGEALSRYPIGWDALKYHLPMVVTWIRRDALVMLPPDWHFSLPGNGDLLSWWLLKAGCEHLASLPNAPLGLILAGAVWTIVRAQRGSQFAAMLAAAITLSAPPIARQMYDNYVDVFGTTFVIGSAATLLLAGSPGRPVGARRLLVFIAGLSLGIAIGAKPVFWGYAAAIAALFCLSQLVFNGRKHDLPVLLPLFALACLACSGFWFLRAGIVTGNPLYPMQVTIGDRVLLPGHSIAVIHSDVPPLANKSLLRLLSFAWTLNAEVRGVGAAFSVFVPSGALLVLVSLIRARPRARIQVAVLTAVAFVLWLTVMRNYARFGMPYLCLAISLAGPCAGWVARFYPRAMRLFAMLPLCLTCASVLTQPVDSWLYRLRSHDLSRTAYYRLPPLIDRLPPSRILNLTPVGGNALTYPLYGAGLRHDVPDSMKTLELFPDLKPSLAQLQANRVEYVFLQAPYPSDWPREKEIELVYDGDSDPSRLQRTPPSRLYRIPIAR